MAAGVATTVFPLPPAPPPPPPPLPMPEVEPLPELTVLREFWLPCGVRFPISSVRLGAWVLLWWEEAGDGGTSPSALTRDGGRGYGEKDAKGEDEGQDGQKGITSNNIWTEGRKKRTKQVKHVVEIKELKKQSRICA